MTNKLLNDPPLQGCSETNMNSLNSLELDYDLWEGQFQIMVPFAETSELNDSTNGDDINRDLLNGNFPGDLKSRLTTVGSRLPITQILDSEDVFLSLHPSDFESLSIANANAGTNSIVVIENDNDRNFNVNLNGNTNNNRIRNTGSSFAFPKLMQQQNQQHNSSKIVKGKDLNCSEFVKVNSETATELLQNRLSEQVNKPFIEQPVLCKYVSFSFVIHKLNWKQLTK